MVDTDKVLSLLSQGISDKATADAVGCTVSYISQLRADPAFSERLTEQKTARLQQDLSFDTRIRSAQDIALARIESTLPFADLGRALGALKVLSQVPSRKDATVAAPQSTVAVTVQLQLPAFARTNYVIDNSTGQLVEAGGRYLGTIKPEQLEQKAAALFTAVRPSASAPLSLPDLI